MHDRSPTPQINVSRIPGASGIAGGLFAVISMVIFLIGIPALRYFLVGAVAIGFAAALVIRAIHRRNPDTPHTLFTASVAERDAPDRSTQRLDHLRRTLRPMAPLA